MGMLIFNTKKSFRHFSLCHHFNTYFQNKHKNIYFFLIKEKSTYKYINGCVSILTKCYFHNTCAPTSR